MQKRLKNICKLYYGKNLPEKDFQNGDYPVCGANGIIGYHNQFTHSNEMLLVSCRGENSGVIHISPPYSFITNNSIICEFETDDVDTKFLYFFLKSQKREKLTSGSAQPQITTFDLGRFKLPELPPKPEQTAIATLLSKVDEAIAATQNSIKAAEKLKKALMQNLLTGKLKPDGSWRTDEEFYEDEKFGKVPKGWEVKSIDELVNRKKDTIDPIKSKKIYDYVGLEHIAQSEFIRVGKGKSNETLALKVVFDKGDLLYGKLRPYLNKVWLADISGVGSTEFLVFEQNEFIEWVYFNLQSKRFLDFTSSMTAGTQHPRASWRDVKRFQVIKPTNYDELKIISHIILKTEKDKEGKQTKIQTLQRLKKSLMQNLLTGKVRLPQAFIAQFNDELLMVNDK